MDAALSIAASGLNASMTEIDVATENLANSQTAGYVSQTAQLSTLPGGGMLGVGGGVQVSSIAQVSDAMLSANNLQAQGALSSLSALQQVLTGVQNVFPLGQTSSASSVTSSNTSIAGQLASFWSAWDSVAQDPSSPAPRTQIVDLAQGIATSLNEASTQLGQLAANAANQVQSDVAQVNTLLGQAASLNQSIVTTRGGGASSNQLTDQLDNVVGQLSSLAGVSVQMQANGSAQVYIGGVAVVQANQADTLKVTSSAGAPTITAYPTAADAQANVSGVPVTVSSGSLAGLLTGLNPSVATSVPAYQAQLNTVANDLAQAVNTQLAQGYTASGAAGSGYPLFQENGTSGTPVTAAGITVNTAVAADPSLLAAGGSQIVSGGTATPIPLGAGATAGTPIGANDGSNAQAMAELGSAPAVQALSSGAVANAGATAFGSPDVAYQNLVENVGADTQNTNTQVAAQTAVANQAQQALQAISGVNQDTQLAALMSYQANYQASAKVVSVIDQTMQSLLAAV